MELVAEGVHRALAYVSTLNQEGYLPSPEQVEAFAASPGPREGSAVPRHLGQLVKQISAIAASREFVREAEPVVEYLIRMDWIMTAAGGLRMTDCGAALLRGLGRAEVEDNQAVEIILDNEDPLVYVQLTRLVAGVEQGCS